MTKDINQSAPGGISGYNVNLHLLPPIPKEFEPFRKALQERAKSSAVMRFVGGPVAPWGSKLGGVPYFPYDAEPEYHSFARNFSPWPKCALTGTELPLLLQLNFGDLPPLPRFPREGLLQLFVDQDAWHELGTSLRAIYRQDVTRDPELIWQDFGDVDFSSHRVKEMSIVFDASDEFVSPSSLEFHSVAARIDGRDVSLADFTHSNQERWRQYLLLTDHRFKNKGEPVGYGRCKVGGYHYSQNCIDPRPSGEEEWELLLQLQDYAALSWGDGGACQFFIRTADLKRLDFTRLRFFWDST